MVKSTLIEASEGETFEFEGQEYPVGADVVIITLEDGSKRLVHKSTLKEDK